MTEEETTDAAPTAVCVVLVLMIKNEARILQRCLSAAAPAVDAVLFVDTGSEDETQALARAFSERPCKLVEDAWEDFGCNRTKSLEHARRFASEELGWELERSYALVLDADMCLRGSLEQLRAVLAEHPLQGVQLLQRLGDLSYYNTRLLRLSEPWRCEGLTHEYWTGANAAALPAAVAWVEDFGDGGSKEDKFERDERLLLRGLAEQPTSERYIFYIAQTYHCKNEPEKAIEWYRKRIAAGGWDEEVWYSHYMIAANQIKLDRLEDAERTVRESLPLQPDRIEAALLLVSHLRERANYAKAWEFLMIAASKTKPASALFLEEEAYGHRLQFEHAFLHFFVRPEEPGAGALLCLSYEGPWQDACLKSLASYARMPPLLSTFRLTFDCPEGFYASSVSVYGDLLCVRCVSYIIAPDGGYLMPRGKVETRNFALRWSPRERLCSDWRELLPAEACAARWRRDEPLVLGLEDVRLFGEEFTATTREFSYCEQNRMVHGRVDGSSLVFAPVRPPSGETACEKNWLPAGAGRIIYAWHPLLVGEVVPAADDGPAELRLLPELSHSTPRWFRHLRGSAPPIEREGCLWVLTHVVAPAQPRQYYLVWVVLDAATFRPLRHSDPFFLHHHGVEYCLGASLVSCDDGDRFQLFLSVWDRESYLVELAVDAFPLRELPGAAAVAGAGAEAAAEAVAGAGAEAAADAEAAAP